MIAWTFAYAVSIATIDELKGYKQLKNEVFAIASKKKDKNIHERQVLSVPYPLYLSINLSVAPIGKIYINGLSLKCTLRNKPEGIPFLLVRMIDYLLMIWLEDFWSSCNSFYARAYYLYFWRKRKGSVRNRQNFLYQSKRHSFGKSRKIINDFIWLIKTNKIKFCFPYRARWCRCYDSVLYIKV